jgi:hypothetical protein
MNDSKNFPISFSTDEIYDFYFNYSEKSLDLLKNEFEERLEDSRFIYDLTKFYLSITMFDQPAIVCIDAFDLVSDFFDNKYINMLMNEFNVDMSHFIGSTKDDLKVVIIPVANLDEANGIVRILYGQIGHGAFVWDGSSVDFG